MREWKGFPFILVVRGGGIFFFEIVFDVQSGLSTIHFQHDSGH